MLFYVQRLQSILALYNDLCYCRHEKMIASVRDQFAVLALSRREIDRRG